MRFLFLIIGLLLGSLQTQAQEEQTRRFKAGIITGANFAQITGDGAAGYNKLGLVAGLRVAIILKERVDLGIEMLFSQRGSAQNKPRLGIPFKFTQNYVEVPITINYMDWLDEEGEYYKLQFHAGLAYGRLFSFSTDNLQLKNAGDFYRDNDVSWLAGATFFANEHLGVTARYIRSLYPFFTANDISPNLKSLTGYHLSLQILYMF